MRKLLSALLVLSGFVCGPGLSQQHQGALEHHGTCATVITGKPGIAFIVDSRLTVTQGDRIIGQHPVCKVRLARPTILIAGIGLTDTTGRSGVWNSLDAASSALQSLAPDPTPEQLDSWGKAWKDSLVEHFRKERAANGNPPKIGPLSEMLLITRVRGEPYFNRVTVQWDGSDFITDFFGEAKYDDPPNVQYSGVCRNFVVHGNQHLPPTIQRTPVEEKRLAYWGNRKLKAKSIRDLAHAAYGFESVLTHIDKRIEGDRALISPPYASAEWPNDSKGWITKFNEECKRTESSLVKPATK